jgi:hypothetical protein
MQVPRTDSFYDIHSKLVLKCKVVLVGVVKGSTYHYREVQHPWKTKVLLYEIAIMALQFALIENSARRSWNRTV